MKSGCIRGKLAVFGKVVVLGQSGCNRAKVVLFGQKKLYSGKNGCSQEKVVVFRQSSCSLARWLF